MSLSRTLQYLFLAIIVTTVGFSLYQWNASRASTQKTAPNNGLVGYWSFDEGTGTQAGDASVNKNTGILTNGPTWVAGKLGKALSFDGVNDYVYLGDVSTEATDYTVSLWYWYVQGSTAGDVFSRGRSSACFYNPRFYVDASGWLPIESGCSGDGYLNVVPLHNGWNHLVMTRSGQTAKSYLDGVLKQTDGSQPGGLGSNNSKMLIGNEYVSYSPDVFAGTLSGSVDEVRIYNRAISGTEITNLYNLGAEKLNVSPVSNLTSGLVGYWTFDGKDTPWSSSSAGTAIDRSGNSNTGTLTNMSRSTSPAEGKLGQALNFDGVDDYVVSGNPSWYGSTWTWSAWVYLRQNPATTNGFTIINHGTGFTGNGAYMNVYNTAGATQLFITTNKAGTSYQANETSTFPLNSWQFVTATKNGSALSLYRNGILVGTGVDSGSITPTGNMEIGRYTNGAVQYWPGLIDDVRLYNRALSAGEIQSLYDLGASDKVNSSVSQNQGTGRLDSGLVGYWKLDDASGTTATDSSTNANSGTLTNGPTWGTGRIGGDVVFDGSNDYIDLGNRSVLNLTNNFSISLWVNINNITQGYWKRFFGGDDINGTTRPVYMEYDYTANQYRAVWQNGGTYGSIAGKTLTAVGWQHFVVTFKDGTAKSYSDGVLINSSSGVVQPPSNAVNSYIGGTYGGGSFPGSIDEVRVYNRVLSDDEVSQLYRLTTPTGVDTSLKGYWSFNGPDLSGTTAYDRSGNANNGTLTNGPTIIEGKLGQALNFDGVNDYVDLAHPSSLKIATPLSVEAWVYRTGATTDFSGIVSSEKDSSNQGGYILVGTSGNKARFYIDGSGSGGWAFAETNSIIPLNSWTHLVGLWDGATTKLYVNGTLQTTTASTATIGYGTFSQNAYIGRYAAAGAAAYWPGQIDEVRVYNRALSSTEVSALYNAGR